MLKRYQIVNQKIVETAEEKAAVLLYLNPDEAEKRRLVDEYQIDEHTLASALDPDEQSRLECEPNHIAFIFKRPKNYSGDDQLLFKASTMGAFFFGDVLILVAADDTVIFEGKQLARVTSLRELTIRLVYRAIYHFMEHLRIINMMADDVEHKINKAMENRYLINLFALQKSLVYYQNAVGSNGVLIEKMRHNAGRFGFTQEEMELLDDLVIENSQCEKQAEIYSNIFASLMDARASIVNNNLSVLMKTLNIITITIMVPTFVVSLFSMNVGIPLSERPWAFWVIMGMSAAAAGIVGLLWRIRNRKR